MAKVTAPLLSIAASGQFAKTMVAGVWKGIKYMRQYVTPSNPQTAGQTTQRGYFQTLVDEWHNVLRLVVDKIAFNARATKTSLKMSGFNLFMRLYLDFLVAGDIATYFYGMAGIWSAASKKVTVTGDCNLALEDCNAFFYNKAGQLIGEGELASEADKSFNQEVNFVMDVAPYYMKVISNTALHNGETGYYIVTSGA